MGDLLDDYSQPFRQYRRGDIVDGVIVRMDRDEVLVDIGAKSEAVVPLHEIPRSFTEGPEALRVGSEVLAYVLQGEDAEGRVVLSLSRAQAERGWRDLEKIREDATTVEGTVAEFNKGGLIVNVMGVRGFVPLSQIADLKRAGDESIEQRLEALKGRKVLLKVIEINRRRNRLILSERQALQERRAREKERLLAELQPGERRRGVVSSICDFGAFVDLGGADGLIHLSELSWAQVSHPSQVLKVGQDVEVYIVGIDRENRKIALSLKRLQAEPWADISTKYQLGQVVDGRITKLATFGAFAEIEPGVEGLIHISELSDERITHPKQVVREGEEVRLRVIRVDASRHRLGLSLRQADYPEGVQPARPVEEPAADNAGQFSDRADAGESEPSGPPEPGDTVREGNDETTAEHDLQEGPQGPGAARTEEAIAHPEKREASVAES
jgi:small subunit ribosomal protein S1